MTDDDGVIYMKSEVDEGIFCALCGSGIVLCADCDAEFKLHDEIYCGSDGTHICKACFEDRLWI